MDVGPNVLEAIGGTSLVRLSRVVPPGTATVLAKLEFQNPTGSMKDRVAKAMVEAAERDGRLAPGGTVVEYTAGTTGISLALVCAAKGYGLKVVFSDAFSEDKRRTMEAFGAHVQTVRSDRRRITEALIREMIATAAELGRQPGHWFCNQLENRDGEAGYGPMGEEIWEQTGGRLDAFVQAVGTAHSILGASAALRRHNPSIRVVAVEPAESAVLSGQPTGAHRIEGIGIGYLPPLWEPRRVDRIVRVSSLEAQAMARRLAREEGLFVGSSSGANVLAAIELGRELGPRATVVTVMVDSGLRYLSSELYGPGPS